MQAKKPQPEVMICSYQPQTGKTNELLQILRGHERKLRTLGFALATAVMMIGCGQSQKSQLHADQSDAEFLKGFLTLADVTAPTPLMEYSEEEIGSVINEQEAFVHHRADVLEFIEKADGCFETAFKKAPVKASKNRLEITFETDLTECRKKEMANPNVTVDKDFVKSQFRVVSTTTDLSEFHGKKAEEYEKALRGGFIKNDTLKTIDHFQSITTYRATETDGTFTYTSTLNAITAKEDGSPYDDVYKNWKNHMDGLVDRSATTISDFTVVDGEPKTTLESLQQFNEYARFEFKDVVAENGKDYFSSGTIEFTLNTWNGEMNFTSAEKPPMWKASFKDLKASGTLAESFEEAEAAPAPAFN